MAELSHTDWTYLPNCLVPEDKTLPQGISRIAAAVEYNGRAFCGWQRQSHSPSVQREVEKALSFVANEEVVLVCAGRTDTGVHATNQIIHFDTRAARTPENWIQGANSRLPEAVRLHWAASVDGHFHARFSALARTYRYLIVNEPYPSALFRGMLTWVRAPLDVAAMHQSAQALLGERDFTSFRAAGCQSRSPNRFLERIAVLRRGRLVVIELTANAFLHHMVRNIAGTLLEVGRGVKPISWPGELLALKDRTRAAATAPADGLYLVSVQYPNAFEIPLLPKGPLILNES